MHIHNADIAAVFNEIADLLELQDENPFRIRAYRNAAHTVDMLGPSVEAMVAEGKDLDDLPGVGPDLAGKMTEIVKTGTCGLREQLHQLLPAGIHEMLQIPGLGPRRAKQLYQELGIHTPHQLLEAALEGRVKGIRGFGERAEQRLLETVQSRLSKEKRFGIAVAAQLADPLVQYLKEFKETECVQAAGSFRRMKETVGDLDIVASSRRTQQVTQHFLRYAGASQVLAQGTTRASARFGQGMQVDLRVVSPASFGAALHYFTGSKAHNIEIRKLAQARGLKLNEYGVFSGASRIAGDTEQSVFAAVGLPWIPPELRENRGEIEAAREGRLPSLVRLEDLQGDLHVHTKASDGRNSLREMALEARSRGLKYIGITDHSKAMKLVHGLDAAHLARQIDEIDALNADLEGIVLLKGVEVDILEDGSLDLPDDVLKRLDFVLGAVHSHFGLSKEQQTKRIMRAMDNPCFTLLAHPTGRLLFQREPCDLDMERVIRHAKERGCFLELDAQPDRLDLNDNYCMMARGEGVLVSIDSDAHSVADFNGLAFGVGQARRGWLEKDDVLNTQDVTRLKAAFAGAMGKPAARGRN